MTTHCYPKFLVIVLLTLSSCMAPATLPSSESSSYPKTHTTYAYTTDGS